MALDAEQARNAAIITQIAKARGYSPSQIQGILANAWHESGFRNNKPGDGGHSIGLFQLNDAGGVGVGMTVAQRMDPVVNTNKILDVAAAQGLTPQKAPQDAGEFASAFVYKVERPKDKAGDAAKRSATAKSGLWGNVASGVQGVASQIQGASAQTGAAVPQYAASQVPMVDINALVQQAMTGAQTLDKPVPGYDAYLNQVKAARQASLVQQINALDAATASALDKINGNFKTSQANVALTGDQAMKDYMAIQKAQKTGQSGLMGEIQGSTAAQSAALSSLGVDPSGFAGAAQGAVGQVQDNNQLGADTLAQTTATSGDINTLLQQMLSGTRDAGLANVEAQALGAKTQLNNSASKADADFLQQLAGLKYQAEANKDPNKLMLDLLGVLTNAATNNQSAALTGRGQDLGLQGQREQNAVTTRGQTLDYQASLASTGATLGSTAERKYEFDLSSAEQKRQFDAELNVTIDENQKKADAAQRAADAASGKTTPKTAAEKALEQTMKGVALRNATLIRDNGATVDDILAKTKVGNELKPQDASLLSDKDIDGSGVYQAWLIAMAAPGVPRDQVEMRLRTYWDNRLKKTIKDKDLRRKSAEVEARKAMKQIKELAGESVFTGADGNTEIPLNVEQKSLFANGNAMIGPDPLAVYGTPGAGSGEGARSGTGSTISNPSIFG